VLITTGYNSTPPQKTQIIQLKIKLVLKTINGKREKKRRGREEEGRDGKGKKEGRGRGKQS